MRRIFAALGLSLALFSIGLSPSALAATSADATIFNKATLTYSGGSVSAGVAVKVALKAAAPTLSAPADNAIASGSDLEYLYTLTSNANGKDSYSLSASSVDATVGGGSLAAPGLVFYAGASGSTAITSLELGGAITADSSLAGKILIPAGSEVNLTVGDTVVIPAVGAFAGGTYTISAVTPGTVPTLSVTEVLTQISLTPTGASPAIGAGDVPAGVQLGEQSSFRLVVTGGNITGTPTSATHTVTLTATSSTDAGQADTDVTVTSVTRVTVFMTKKVALYNPALSVESQSYVTSGLTAKPGDVLIYQIEVGPAVGEPDITDAVVTDPLPEYTTYVTDSLTLNAIQVNCPAGCPAGDIAGSDGGVSPLIAGMDVNSKGDASDDGSGEDGVGTRGVIKANNTAVVTFRVTVE